jgi:hypothetical protein
LRFHRHASSFEELRRVSGEGQVEDIEDQERRSRLHQLDAILEALEQLNLRNAKELTPSLHEHLELAGVEVPVRPNITSLIEQVWDLQERYLRSADVEGGRTAVTRRLRR